MAHKIAVSQLMELWNALHASAEGPTLFMEDAADDIDTIDETKADAAANVLSIAVAVGNDALTDAREQYRALDTDTMARIRHAAPVAYTLLVDCTPEP